MALHDEPEVFEEPCRLLRGGRQISRGVVGGLADEALEELDLRQMRAIEISTNGFDRALRHRLARRAASSMLARPWRISSSFG